MNKQLLGIHNVCLSYGERHVLCHIEARVNQGDCIVLVPTAVARPPCCGSWPDCCLPRQAI